MRAVSSLEVGEWILYEWHKSERIGRIASAGKAGSALTWKATSYQ